MTRKQIHEWGSRQESKADMAADSYLAGALVQSIDPRTAGLRVSHVWFA
jgi:hypothetical protein